MNDAIARHQAMVAQYPDNELARFSLGKAFFDAGQFAEAKPHLEFALSKRADWMVVQILIGRCEIGLGNKEAARAAIEQAHRLALAQNHEGPRRETELLLQQLGV